LSITTSRRLINLISLCGFFALIFLTVYFYHLGIFNDLQNLQEFVSQATLWAPFVFVLIQILQVVIPIIPGGISLAAGVLLFGPLEGFLYNYIGICIGSLILFWLGRQYGKPLVLRLGGLFIPLYRYLYRLLYTLLVSTPIWITPCFTLCK